MTTQPAASHGEAAFSLYSTDTEEQMASVNRGLDRCATLLKCLLSPDDGKQRQNHCQNVGVAKRKLVSRHGNKVVMKHQKKKHIGVSSDIQPKFPGALKHLHTHTPQSSSTPVKRHVRSKTEPLPVETPPTSNVSHTTNEQHQVKVHRRLKSASTQRRKPFRPLTVAEKKQTDHLRPSSAGNISNSHPHLLPLATTPYHHPPMYYHHPWCSCYYQYWQETRQPTNVQEQLTTQPFQSGSLPCFTHSAVSTNSGPTELHMIQSLTQDMQRSVETCLTNIKHISGEGATSVQKIVEELCQLLIQQFEQIRVQCQHLSGRRIEQPLSSSTMELISQLEQLESEKSKLFERVLRSDAAYSECCKELDKTKRKQHELQNELKLSNSKVKTLKRSLHWKDERLGKMTEQFRTVEEDSQKTKHMVHQLTTKSSVLQHQVDTLRHELSQQSKESGHDHHTQMKCSLETAHEEIEMMKVSLSAKEEQLTQYQDKLLGLRQCLAHFLSELTKMKPRDDNSPLISVDYCVSGEAVERIQSLVNDGNIETFLSSYMNPRNQSSQQCYHDSSPANDSTCTTPTLTPTSQTPTQATPTDDVISPLQSSSQTDNTNKSIKGDMASQPPVGTNNEEQMFPLPSVPPSSSSVSAITGVSGMTTSSEIEFRRDLATLDHDIARLQMQFKIAMQV